MLVIGSVAHVRVSHLFLPLLRVYIYIYLCCTLFLINVNIQFQYNFDMVLELLFKNSLSIFLFISRFSPISILSSFLNFPQSLFQGLVLSSKFSSIFSSSISFSYVLPKLVLVINGFDINFCNRECSSIFSRFSNGWSFVFASWRKSKPCTCDSPFTRSENYSAWARALRKALLTKNKLGFIDGTLTLSSPLVSTPSVVQAWIRWDNMVGTWLTNSVSPKL